VQDNSKLQCGPGGALHVGEPPAKPVAPYTALLPGRPDKDALRLLQAGLVLEAGARGEPLLLLVMAGRPTITLRGGWACFEKVLLICVPSWCMASWLVHCTYPACKHVNKGVAKPDVFCTCI
jgi:hypothetical protein